MARDGARGAEDLGSRLQAGWGALLSLAAAFVFGFSEQFLYDDVVSKVESSEEKPAQARQAP